MTAEELRPQTLDEMVGQAELRAKARIAIGAALARDEPLPHCLLTSSGGGLGKTSFAGILANEMFAPYLRRTGQCLQTPLDLRHAFVRLEPKTVLLVDEAHAVGRSAAEELLIVLEEGVMHLSANGKPIRLGLPAFTLIAATTKPECFCSTPLGQRFSLHFHFDFYNVGQLTELVERIFQRWELGVKPSVSELVAKRARGTPRIALRLCERVRDVAQACGQTAITEDCFDKAMVVEGIDRLGLTAPEQKVLWRLRAAHPRPLSARSLATALGVQVETIYTYEQLLIRYGLAEIGPGGRRITDSGLAHLEAVRQENVAR